MEEEGDLLVIRVQATKEILPNEQLFLDYGDVWVYDEPESEGTSSDEEEEP